MGCIDSGALMVGSAAVSPQPNSVVTSRPQRILVVDDSEDNRQILRDLLTNAAFVVLEASDGVAGLAQAKAERPDLIIMEVGLPVMDGYEATRRLKSDPDLMAIPVVAVSSYAMSGDEERSRAAGCNGYIPKPFSPSSLLRVVRSLLAGPDARSGP